MAKKSLPAVAGKNLPANWEKQLAADAAKYTQAEAAVGIGQFMSTRAGVLSFGGTPVPGNKMPCVVVDSILENALYEGKFDPDTPASPVCFAFGRDEAELAPHKDSPKPKASSCAECEFNKFGSAEQGRGKACKNGRRLAIIHADTLKGDLARSPLAFLKVPPTSLPSWATYVKGLAANLEKPPYAVVTELSIVPDPKSQFKLLFTLEAPVKDRKVLGGLYAKHLEAEAAIDFPYQPTPAAPTSKPHRAAAPKKAPRGRR